MDERSKSGSSRNFMGRGEKVESTAVEKDSGAVVQEIAEAPGIGLQGLDFGVGFCGRGALHCHSQYERFRG